MIPGIRIKKAEGTTTDAPDFQNSPKREARLARSAQAQEALKSGQPWPPPLTQEQIFKNKAKDVSVGMPARNAMAKHRINVLGQSAGRQALLPTIPAAQASPQALSAFQAGSARVKSLGGRIGATLLPIIRRVTGK